MKSRNPSPVLALTFLALATFSCIKDHDLGNPFQPPVLGSLGAALPYTVLGTESGVEIRNGGFGSAAVAHPHRAGEFYALTDRGPNADATDGKYFPVPNYTPRIGHFRLTNDGKVEKISEILLKNPAGQPVSGRPNPVGKGATGEIPYDLNDNVLAYDDFGIDSEGLVAMKDGTFWVSDEYGPHIAHYKADGTEIERISPIGVNTGSRKLPAVFARRRANRGMEGLAITPDEKMLVGIMQSRMYNPTNAGATNKTLTRIVTFELATGNTNQYLFKQEINDNSNSEITALSATEFLVVERDGNFSGDGPVMKHIYRINLTGATDVSGEFDSQNGLLVKGKTLEANSWAELAAANIIPVTKTLAVDLINALGDYPHDKLEGLWLIDAHTLGVLNDDDFAITSNASKKIAVKYLPPTNTIIDGGRLYIVNF